MTSIDKRIINLIEAERKANILFEEIENRHLIIGEKTEHELNKEVFNLAYELFGIKKFWHKRIVRSGKNTLLPYEANPINLTIQKDDILFFDFGPVFENWEADIGKTYVLGTNQKKLKLKRDVELAWQEGKAYFDQNKNRLTGANFYHYTKALAKKYGWEYGNHHCGHLIGNFPHEKILGEEEINYIHPNNNLLMTEKDNNGDERFWIYEIHFIDRKSEIGGFFEQLLS
ncbi:M24 family metallopeptidase [Lacinutrix sp. Hel_I_90]|uniref:M24 family metallopeptidase n=1 Tax=Lacinutrix sp. Hel_I_90 TaxID=1249999 RepID=UPI0005C9D6C9|nr:M24 family metallopeptidase [Lacinutrix sp. Hel_I_90]